MAKWTWMRKGQQAGVTLDSRLLCPAATSHSGLVAVFVPFLEEGM